MPVATKHEGAGELRDGPRAKFFWTVTLLLLLIGGLKRLSFPGSIDFPLGEGGLFVLFSDEILRAGFALPHSVAFGGEMLPFAYPPAAFYLAAGFAKLAGTDLLITYHVLPRVLNLLAIPAFCLFAARISRDRVIFAVAALFFALMPESFAWQITGGGMPRALAALLALLALATAVPLSEGRNDRNRTPLTGLLVGCTLLSHLEWGMFAAIGVSLLLATRLPLRRSLVLLLAIGAVSLLVILPWLALVLAQHGIDPFLSSSSASHWSAGETLKRVLAADLFASTLTLPALAGVVRLVRRRDPFLILWAPITLLTTPRMALSSGLGIPTAMLAAYGLREIADLVARFAADERSASWRRHVPNLTRSVAGFPLVLIALAFFFTTTLVTNVQWSFVGREQLAQVSPANRAAMTWIRQNTPADSRFVLVTADSFWYFDRVAEWFPYLAGRESLTTAQGLEWAGPGVFDGRIAQIARLKASQAVEPGLLPAFIRKRHCNADHVAVFLPDVDTASRAFAQSADFQPVLQRPDASVYRVRQGRLPCNDTRG